jgi:hypothetical protein
MKNKFSSIIIAVICFISIFSCKEQEEEVTSSPSIVGTWELYKVHGKFYVSNRYERDTIIFPPSGTSTIFIMNENKTMMQIYTENGETDTFSGTYSVVGTTLIATLIDPSDNSTYTDEYDNIYFSFTELNMTGYDPNKTYPDRLEMVAHFKRK